MKFINVRLLVSDMAEAIRFWRDVMGLSMKYGDEAMGYAYFETDSAGVELMTRKGFADALGEVTRNALRVAARVDEDQCRAVLGNELGQTVVDLQPDIA